MRVHFVGIGGSGMSGLARVMARQGQTVTGSDQAKSPTLALLRSRHGIVAHAGHAAENVAGADLVVISAAIRKTNPEVIAAHDLGIPVISRAEMLGRLMSDYPRSIAVSGTHGKTTTTSMIAMVLEAAEADATVLIGGDLAALGGNARLGSGDTFLAEACEAYDSFLDLDPTIAVVTNIEADHLDYYGDLENILRSFRKFLSQVTRTAILCADDENIRRISGDIAIPKVVTYGVAAAAALRAADIRHDGARTTYAALLHGEPLGTVTLSVPGIHNVVNSLSAVAVGLELGLSFDTIARGLFEFTGAGRRFEKLGETPDGVLVVDDYAHHPTEIRATLNAARRAYPDRRIVAVFQPHLPSRTNDFMSEFAESFADADQVVLTDIYLAREQPIDGVSGAGLAALTAERRGAEHVTYVQDKQALPQRLGGIVHAGDLMIALGAGDIRAAGEGYLALASRMAECVA